MIGKKRPTIADVAKLAGVSEATVSGILNNSALQSPETACKVKNAMHQLGYSPRRNKLRSENRRHTKLKNIALLVPDPNIEAMQTPLVQKLASGIERELLEYGYNLVPCQLKADGTLPDILLGRKQVAGIVFRFGWYDGSNADVIAQNEEVLKKFPFVSTFANTFADGDAVVTDNQSCARWATNQILLQENVKNIICIRPEHVDKNSELYMRGCMLEYFLNLYGLKCKICDNIRTQECKDALTHDEDTAIFVVGHDIDVIETVEELNKKNSQAHIYAILTGDLPVNCVYEKLNTIHIDPYRMGVCAAELLLRRITHPYDMARRMLVPPREFQKIKEMN